MFPALSWPPPPPLAPEKGLKSLHAGSRADEMQWYVHVKSSFILPRSCNKHEAKSFRYGVRHGWTHAPMTLMKKMLQATKNSIKSRALESILSLIIQMHAWAETANARNSCHAQPAAHPDGQSLSTKPKTQQVAHASGTQGRLSCAATADSLLVFMHMDKCIEASAS